MEKCFYVPKKLLDKEYSEYPVESKILFSIILSTAQNSKAIMGCAKLISSLGDEEIRSLKNEMKKIDSGSESEKYV